MEKKSWQEIRQALGKFAKVDLGFYPTPFYKLENMSKKLGINLYIKRDDFSGQALFGGNKIRKLEYLLGDAVAQKAEYVFTYGATQSNHAMQTVECCNKIGLKPVIYLYALVQPEAKNPLGNLLLDKIFGAEVVVVNLKPGETQAEVKVRSKKMGEDHIARLTAAGHKCYDVPVGGASPMGSLGFVEGFVELEEQLQAANIKADYLVHASGSGGTMAGIGAGKKLCDSAIKVISVATGKKDFAAYVEEKAALANATLALLGFTLNMGKEDFCVEPDYYLPGYEQPNQYGTKAIKMLAKEEGLLVDPVYSGKALGCLIDYVERGKIPQGANVVFWHTGGATALFAEKAILGAIY